MHPARASRLLALVVLLSVASVPVAAIPDARLAVTDATASPENPVTGEPVTVTATVRNSAGSASAATLTEVRLETADGETLATADDPGTLSPGETLSVDLVTAFDAAGRTDLQVVAVGEDAAGDSVSVDRPLTVVVEPSTPKLEVSAPRPVANVESVVSVTVSNPATTAIRDLELRLDAPGAVVDRRTIPTLPSGTSQTVNLTYVPSGPGADAVPLSLSYTADTGVRERVEDERGVSVAPLRDDVGVAVRPARVQSQQEPDLPGQLGTLLGGTTQTTRDDEGAPVPDRVAVEVTNFGNARVTEAVVSPSVDDRTLPRVAVGPLAPGESETVTVDLAGVGPGVVTTDVDYRVGERQGSATGQYDYRPPAGEMTVTDVALSVTEDGRLTIAGNAGNTGRADVTGVVVAVGENEHVSPAYPHRDYFVGTVEGSEFAPFELTADVDVEQATSVPVVVRYTVDGEEQTREFTLPYDSSLAPEQDRDGGILSGTVVVALAAGVGLGLLVVGVPRFVTRFR